MIMDAGKTPPALFDRRLIRVRRARGAKQPRDAFLYQRAALDAVERVKDVNRSFSASLLLGNAEISDLITEENGDKLGHVVKADHSNLSHGLDLICDEEALPFADKSFDFIFSGLTLHGVNKIPQVLMDVKRLLRPDGLFICALFGGETLRRLRYALYEAEDLSLGHASPRISPMIELQQAANLLQKAGFAIPVIDRDLVQVSYTSLSSLYNDLGRMGERNALIDRMKIGATKCLFKNLEEIYARDHKNEDGKLDVNFDILWLTGWAPHPGQQKPLKPGSAKSRLSDALGVKEHKV
ncbi:MAG: methyltransferase domain-containing protein [Acidimicrobiales bacterium]|nr:MAG: methyltransferase domain-containing protein [Acidimicrobiales bacterium]